jgi:non-canonical (house-cleaning) NTP pyrophosphatase
MIGSENQDSQNRIVVGSTSEIKLAAVRQAVKDCGWGGDISGMNVPSAVPRQPVGYTMIHSGAWNRAMAVRNSDPNCYAVGIESGIIDQESGWYDVSAVHVIIPGQSQPFGLPAYSAAVSVPVDVVLEVLTRGINQVTIGQLLAERYPGQCQPDDPHLFLTHGKFSRQKILVAVLYHVIKEVRRWNRFVQQVRR